MATILKKTEDNNFWQTREIGTVLCRWQCNMVQPWWEAVWQFIKRPKKRISLWSSNPTSGEEFPRELKVGSWSNIYTLMFIAESFTIAKRQNQPNVHQRMNGWRYNIYIQGNVIQPLKGRKFWFLLQCWMNLKDIMLSQSQKDKNYMISFYE